MSKAAVLLLIFSIAAGAAAADSTLAVVNAAADYVFSTELFRQMLDTDLPAEIKIHSTITIVNLRMAGRENLSRSCDLQLAMLPSGRAQARTCLHVRDLSGSFTVRVLGQPLVQVAFRVADFRARLRVSADLRPSGGLGLDFFDAWLSRISVTNNGLVASIISKALGVASVRESLRLAVAAGLRDHVSEELQKIKLPA